MEYQITSVLGELNKEDLSRKNKRELEERLKTFTDGLPSTDRRL